MIDPDIHAMFEYHRARHADEDFELNMEALAHRFGLAARSGESSHLGPDGTVNLRRGLSARERRSHLAHELSHHLSREGRPSYEQVIRHRHASAPDLPAHLEALADHGGDLLTMPDAVVRAVVKVCGVSAVAVWTLHQMCEVPLAEALRRLVHADPDCRRGGYISIGGVVQSASVWRYQLPFWVGDRVPEMNSPNVSRCSVPGRRAAEIGLILVGAVTC